MTQTKMTDFQKTNTIGKMTKTINEVVCLVVDTGLFLPLALRMAESCKRVLYYNPDQRGFPSVKQGCIGEGFDQIEVVRDLWDHIEDVDLACFPDCQNSGLQLHLESISKAVWGSRNGINLELGRERFMRTLKDIGLSVPTFETVNGVEELSANLKEREDCYVKISRWRGDMETFHWRNWNMDSGWLCWLAVNFGPLASHMRFLVFDKIDTNLEIGGDTYCIDGQWPDTMLNGIEGKDKCYLSAVTKRAEMPEQIQEIMEAIGPVLEGCRYRNQISFEDRVKGDEHFWIDFTGRGGMPSTASQHVLWKNFPDIVWHGANGILIEPVPAAQFSIETMITTKPDAGCWETIEIPKELEPWARFSNCCFVDGCYCFPPDDMHGGDLGWLVAIGDSPKEVLERQKELADMLPDGLNADVESMAGIIKEVEEMENKDIPFTEKSLPDPVSVLE